MARQTKTQLVIEGKDDTQGAFNSVNKSLLGLNKNAIKAGAALAGAFAVVGAGYVAALVKNSLAAADAMTKLASGAGVTTEALSGIGWAASQSGVDLNQLATAMGRLNKGALESTTGAGQYAKTFQSLGISATDATGKLKSADALLLELADIFERMPNGAEKSAIALQLFGRSGAAMIPFLNAGSSGIKDLTAQAERLGLVIGSDFAAQAEEFNDSLAVLGKVSEGAGNKVAANLIGPLNELTGLMRDIAEDGESVNAIAGAMSGILKGLAAAAIIVGASFQSMGQAIGALMAALVMAATGDFKGAAETLTAGIADYATTTKKALERVSNLFDGTYEKEAASAAAATKAKKTELEAKLAEEQKYSIQAKSIRDQLLVDTKEHLKKLVSAQKEANKEIKKAKDEQLETEKRYKEALAILNGTGASDEASYLNASSLKAKSRQQLQAGDIDGAKESAQAALDILLKIKAEGGNDYGFAGFAKELQAIEEAADQIKLDSAQAEFDKLQAEIAAVKLEAETLKNMPISVIVDQESLDAAKTRLQSFADSIGKSITIPISVAPTAGGGEDLPAFASGGRIRGAGTGTSDSILMWGSNGENVIKKRAVDYYGQNFMDNINNMRIPRFNQGGLIGQVSESPRQKNIGTLNFNLPGGDNFSVDVAGTSSLDDLHRAALKFGRTRT